MIVSHRTGTSTSPICECGSDRETAEHFLFHCTKYQHIRKNTVESALDILKCSKKSSVSDNFESLLLSPSIDNIAKSQNRTVKDLLFEFLSGTDYMHVIICHHSHFYIDVYSRWSTHWILPSVYTYCSLIIRLSSL